MTEDTCTLLRCENPFHDHNPSDEGPGLSVMVDPTDPAFEHITRVLVDMRAAEVDLTEETVAAALKLGRLYHSGTATPAAPPTPREALAQHVVYYMRFGPLIKIGTTRNLYARVGALRPDEVLAAEPGGRDIEAQRHREFGRHRIERELFAPGPDLRQHIKATRNKYGPPTQVANR